MDRLLVHAVLYASQHLVGQSVELSSQLLGSRKSAETKPGVPGTVPLLNVRTQLERYHAVVLLFL